METVFKQAIRLMSGAALLALAACSGGGGGGAAPATTASNNNSSSSSNSSNSSSSSNNSSSSGSNNSTPVNVTVLNFNSPPPSCSANVCIAAAGTPTYGNGTPVTENGATPNFATSLPPAGTSFPLMTSGWQISLHTISDANVTGGTVTLQGVTSGTIKYPIFRIQIPSISLDASNVVGDGSTLTLADGSRVNASTGVLSYAALGQWGYFPQTGAGGFDGAALTGYQTQAAHVPTSGTATYIGLGKNVTAQGDPKAGGVSGQLWTPSLSGNPIQGSGVGGDVTVNVNFGTGNINGQLSNMVVGPGGGAWNTVNLNGSLLGASFSGTTSTSGPPASQPPLFPQGFSSAATGTFKGALFGPNANELGAIWTLYEPTLEGGKAAVGVFGATHQ